MSATTTARERQEAARALLYGSYAREQHQSLNALRLERRARPVSSGMLDPELCLLADMRAELMAEHIATLEATAQDDEALRAQLSAWVEALDAKPLPGFAKNSTAAQRAALLVELLDRAVCRLWWRRQLRRRAVLLRELEGRQAGEVCSARQVYCTDDTVSRRMAAQKRNTAMLKETEIESADGEILSLWDAVEKSTANPALRRGELMTRIRGCDEWANAHGFVGIFTTNTTPSRYHSRLASGGINPRWDEESTPREGQLWLRDTWARARAKLHRRKIGVFGLRVAEPHHDGTPHWHMLLWCKPEHINKLRAVLWETWLRDDGDEPGARQHRFKSVELWPGGAAGYCAKYIAKGIDDEGAMAREGHTDEGMDGKRRRVDGSAARVLAWASAWGIRQFQTIGQPPVGVWRELRRVEAPDVAGASARLQAAHAAVHRKDWSRDKETGKATPETRACWRAYMAAQGGPMQGRRNLLAIKHEERPHAPRYGLGNTKAVPVAVLDRESGAMARSARKAWKPRGTWTERERREALLTHAAWIPSQRREALEGVSVFAKRAQPVSPWTRFNNCTRAGGPQGLMGAGIVGARSWNRGREQQEDRHGTEKHPPDPGR